MNQIVNDLTRHWLNEDTASLFAAFEALPPLVAAAVSVAIVKDLMEFPRYHQTAEEFMRWLEDSVTKP